MQPKQTAADVAAFMKKILSDIRFKPAIDLANRQPKDQYSYLYFWEVDLRIVNVGGTYDPRPAQYFFKRISPGYNFDICGFMVAIAPGQGAASTAAGSAGLPPVKLSLVHGLHGRKILDEDISLSLLGSPGLNENHTGGSVTLYVHEFVRIHTILSAGENLELKAYAPYGDSIPLSAQILTVGRMIKANDY